MSYGAALQIRGYGRQPMPRRRGVGGFLNAAPGAPGVYDASDFAVAAEAVGGLGVDLTAASAVRLEERGGQWSFTTLDQNWNPLGGYGSGDTTRLVAAELAHRGIAPLDGTLLYRITHPPGVFVAGGIALLVAGGVAWYFLRRRR